jgi:O-antigen/teichoic acid export membrane protein
VAPLAFGTVAYGLSSLILLGISLARRTGLVLAFTAVAAAVNIALNISLIPPFGFVGAAVGTGLGYLVLAGAAYVVGQRVYRTPYDLRGTLVIFMAAAVASAAGFVTIEPLALALAVKTAAAAAFVVAVWASGAMTRAEFSELGRFLRGMVRGAPPAQAPA